MKNSISLILLCVAISVSVFCQPPQAFKYQALIRNETGNVVSNQSVEIIISIRNETPGGTIIYQETFNTTTNQFGLVNLNIGYNPTLGSFALIDWFADSKFLEVEIDVDGSGVYLSMGTNELLSVPYALYAGRSADGYWDLYNSSIYYISGNVGIGTSTPNARLHVNDRIRIGEDPTYSTVYGELYHEGGGNGFVINSNAGGGSWADIYFQTNGTTKMFIESSGNVGIGTTDLAAGYKLSVDGKVACEEVMVEYSDNWPDYVFSSEYNLLNLIDLEKQIKKYNHLPGIPSAKEIEENGLHLAEMQKLVLQKVEELTLYTIEQGKLINDLQEELKTLKKENQSLRKVLKSQ
ncbi:MAG: hypothetical protein KQI35_05650 [Bacteroidetes bacterium]|nr:hypothetical protein [Bacteroidota bacterium]